MCGRSNVAWTPGRRRSRRAGLGEVQLRFGDGALRLNAARMGVATKVATCGKPAERSA